MLARARHIPLFGGLLASLIGLAWLGLVVWGASPYSRFLDHKNLDALRVDGAPVLIVFVLGWVLMITAMMLPTSVPLIALFGAMVRARSDSGRLIGLLVLGYLSAWTMFGIAVHAGDAVLHLLVDSVPWLNQHVALIAAATVLLAGFYQFTPLKYHCLERCRSPRAFIISRWRGRRPVSEAFDLGIAHGLFCIGCCWSLMLLMFAVGVGSLGWMLVLGAVMAIEKNLPWGRRFSAPVGGLLLAWGTALAIGLAG
jgi:predicted metal-binding membrane protein